MRPFQLGVNHSWDAELSLKVTVAMTVENSERQEALRPYRGGI